MFWFLLLLDSWNICVLCWFVVRRCVSCYRALWFVGLLFFVVCCVIFCFCFCLSFIFVRFVVKLIVLWVCIGCYGFLVLFRFCCSLFWRFVGFDFSKILGFFVVFSFL